MSRRKHKKNKKWWNSPSANVSNSSIVNSGITAGKSISPTWNFKSCSHSPTHIFSLGEDDKNIEFYGATKDQIQTWSLEPTTLVLNVSGYSIQSNMNDMVRGPIEFDCLKTLIPHTLVKELILGWVDGMSFGANVEFWQKFYDICVEKGYKKVIACCLGGHGRTGTALAAILIANAGMDDFNAIDVIRKYYCDEAIETKSQEQYLEKLYFELHPDEQKARDAQAAIALTKTVPNDKVVIDMKTGEVIPPSQLDLSRSNIDEYENKQCAWCGKVYLGEKNNPDDFTCSKECSLGAEEFTGYKLS